MLAVVERFGAERVRLALASEARRKRRRPIKSWRLWAEIVGESLAEEPRAPPREAEEMAALLNGESVPRAALMAAIERWNAGGDWPTSLGGPPRRHGCALPEDVLAMCVTAHGKVAAARRYGRGRPRWVGLPTSSDPTTRVPSPTRGEGNPHPPTKGCSTCPRMREKPPGLSGVTPALAGSPGSICRARASAPAARSRSRMGTRSTPMAASPRPRAKGAPAPFARRDQRPNRRARI